ncbi:retrovirus-related pol polyprotein from transposon TNT 1-94 [Tanacetum coccineum]
MEKGLMLLRPQHAGFGSPKTAGNPQQNEYKEKGVIDSGCSRHMTGNKCYLDEYEDYDGGFISFGDGKGRIYGKGKIKTGSLDFDDVYFCKQLKYNLFSVSQIRDKKNNNGVAEKKYRTLIKDARTMLVDSKLPTTFWAEAVNTACYVINRVLVIKPHNKTPYELILGRPLLIDFMKPFGCPITILNIRDHLGKFDGKADEGYFVGYSVVSKAMKVFNKRTMIVEETLNIRFLENTTNVKGNGPDWLFNVDSLTISMNYVPVATGNKTNGIAGTKDNIVAGSKDYERDARMKPTEVDENEASDKSGKHDQEARKEGKDYDESLASHLQDEAIRLFLAYASFKDFVVYQMDVKSVFLYGKIEEEVYVCQPPGFEDPYFLDKVYKVEKTLYGLHQAPRAWYETLSTYLLENGFHRGQIDKTLFIKRHKDDVLLVQVYVDDIIFGSTKKQMTSTPMETNKALIKDEEAEDVDVHLYRSMIGSLMYLTASRPDIMFVVCACARDSPFDLEAFSDSDYTGAILDRKSATGGSQFLSKRLISWQCKKQTIVANSITEAEYVAAVNLVFHSKTKHIDIRHHFIRDSYEKKLIQVIKIHTDENVADLLIKAFNASRISILSFWQIKRGQDTKVPQSCGPPKKVGDEAVHKELGDRMERAATTASSFEVEQDIGSGPRCQDTILGDVDAQTWFETTSKQFNDPPLSKVNTFGSGKDDKYIRNHKKTIKNKQTQTREWKNGKTSKAQTQMRRLDKSQKPSQKSKPQIVNSRVLLYYGKDKRVFSKALSSSLKP